MKCSLMISLVLLTVTCRSTTSSPTSETSSSSTSPSVPFSVRCPSASLIHPCDCVEIEKGLESEFHDNESLALTDGDEELMGSGEPHPDIIETVVFCKHIYSRKQLIESMKPFKGHRINYLVLDSCNIPPFPTNIFNQINILWMEVLNSTIQFREPFFDCAANCL